MKDIELNRYKKIVYVIGWIFTCLNLFLILITFGICLFKDRGNKKVKGKLTRSFEKFVYVVGMVYSVIIPIGITYGFVSIMFFDDSLDYLNNISLNFTESDYLDIEQQCEDFCLESEAEEYQLLEGAKHQFVCNCYEDSIVIAASIFSWVIE